MANSNPYLILTRVRNSVISELRDIFSPANNAAVVPAFEYSYIETASSTALQFYGNPINGDTITITNSVSSYVITFGVTVQIGGTQQITLANLVAYINANSSTLFIGATTNSIPNKVTLTATFAGVSGNAIGLVTTSRVLKFSSPTLINGGLFDFDNSNIFISDAVPQDYQDWPCLVVNTASANETRYLGPEDSFQVKNNANVVTTDEIFSSLVVNVDIKLYTVDDTIARDKIIDLIYNNMSEIRTQLAINGIEMIDRTMPTETRIAQNQRIYIENHLILRVYCEWSDNLLPIVNVASLSITVPVDTSAPPVVNSPLDASWSSQSNPFTIVTVTDGIHLVVASTAGLVNGNTIQQGVATTTITNVVDSTHLVVGSTTGFAPGPAYFINPFNYIITASNSPTSYAAVGLPAGLIVNAGNGLISGIPTPAGTYYITLSAINATGTGTKSLTLTVS